MLFRSSGIVLAVAACYALFIGFDAQHSTGEAGATRKNGSGCVCHGFTPASAVTVWIEGPESVLIGSQTIYRVRMTGGPAIAGGFNVATRYGSLVPSDSSSFLLDPGNGDSLELTHMQPKPFQNDTVEWSFQYRAPSVPDHDTLYSAGNSVNLNTIPTGDQWNFGTSFIVTVHSDTTDAVEEETGVPTTFSLFQNYPNPFNPVTTISYELPQTGMVTLTITDLLGRTMATLVQEREQAGRHEVVWDASKSTSGVYLARLTFRGAVQTRKMLYLR